MVKLRFYSVNRIFKLFSKDYCNYFEDLYFKIIQNIEIGKIMNIS